MDRDSINNLRLDRRLIRRRGWLSKEDLAGELEKLPDTSHKSITLGDATDRVEAPSAAGPSGGPEVAPPGPSAPEIPRPE